MRVFDTIKGKIKSRLRGNYAIKIEKEFLETYHRKLTLHRGTQPIGKSKIYLEGEVEGKKYPIRILSDEAGKIKKWNWILPDNKSVPLKDLEM